MKQNLMEIFSQLDDPRRDITTESSQIYLSKDDVLSVMPNKSEFRFLKT